MTENGVSGHTWKEDVEFCAGGVGGDAGSCKGAEGRWGGASGGGIPAANEPGIAGVTTNLFLFLSHDGCDGPQDHHKNFETLKPVRGFFFLGGGEPFFLSYQMKLH